MNVEKEKKRSPLGLGSAEASAVVANIVDQERHLQQLRQQELDLTRQIRFCESALGKRIEFLRVNHDRDMFDVKLNLIWQECTQLNAQQSDAFCALIRVYCFPAFDRSLMVDLRSLRNSLCPFCQKGRMRLEQEGEAKCKRCKMHIVLCQALSNSGDCCGSILPCEFLRIVQPIDDYSSPFALWQCLECASCTSIA